MTPREGGGLSARHRPTAPSSAEAARGTVLEEGGGGGPRPQSRPRQGGRHRCGFTPFTVTAGADAALFSRHLLCALPGLAVPWAARPQGSDWLRAALPCE